MKETTLQNIQVQGVKTTIKDLIIENENLAEYLLESDNRVDLTLLSKLGSQIDTSITAASNAKGILRDLNTRVQTRLNLIKDVLDDN